jgi:rhomboid protease GluP
MEFRSRPVGKLAIWCLLLINSWVFLRMSTEFDAMDFNAQQAAEWGAVYDPLVSKGEIWRLVAGNYIHFDFKHILCNMMALFSWGMVIADRLGLIRFTVLYSLSGLAASVTSLLTHPNTVCAGASGPISGVLGGLIAIYFAGEKSLSGSALLQAVFYSAVYSVLMPSIDWQAHAGGFVAGIILGYLLTWTLPERYRFTRQAPEPAV